MGLRAARTRGEDRYLEWKVRLFSVAAVLGLTGIYFDEHWMTGSAILLLGSAVMLRFLPGGAGFGRMYGEDEGEGEGDEDGASGDEPAEDSTPR